MKTRWIRLLALWSVVYGVQSARSAGLPAGLADSEWQKIRSVHAMTRSAAQPAVLGAPESRGRVGAAARVEAIVQQAYLKASNTEAQDNFGYSVAISGDTVVVGAIGESSNAKGVNGNASNNSSDSSGAVYVFVRSEGAWTQQAYLKASNTGAGDAFGRAVAISGDTLVVGARYESSSATGVNGNQASESAPDSGAVYVFVRSGTQWTQQAYLKASNTGLADWFGNSVAIDKDTVVVGAKGEASNASGVDGNQKNNSLVRAGAAYVFARSGTNWSQEAYLKAIQSGEDHQFGASVAVSADTVVVGAYGESGESSGVNGDPSNQTSPETGAAYVFTRTNRVWAHQAYLKASNPSLFGWFGYSVALSGDTAVVGAIGDSSNARGVNGNQTNTLASDSGAAYVFTRTGSTWTQQAYLKASNTGEGDSFGSSVAVWGDTVIVGADTESSSGRGINSTVANQAAEFAGAAYVFTRNGPTWKQQAYLKSSNTRTFYRFGNSVAFEAGTAVIGSFGEDSNATGVNGNQQNTAADAAGAAYVFTGLGTALPTPGALLSVGAGGGVGVAGERQLTVQGVPGLTYHLQSAGAVGGPWKDVVGAGASGTTDGAGKRVLVDAAAPDETTFYRAVEP